MLEAAGKWVERLQQRQRVKDLEDEAAAISDVEVAIAKALEILEAAKTVREGARWVRVSTSTGHAWRRRLWPAGSWSACNNCCLDACRMYIIY